MSTRNFGMTYPFGLVIIVFIKINGAECCNQLIRFAALDKFLQRQRDRILLRFQSAECLPISSATRAMPSMIFTWNGQRGSQSPQRMQSEAWRESDA